MAEKEKERKASLKKQQKSEKDARAEREARSAKSRFEDAFGALSARYGFGGAAPTSTSSALKRSSRRS